MNYLTPNRKIQQKNIYKKGVIYNKKYEKRFWS